MFVNAGTVATLGASRLGSYLTAEVAHQENLTLRSRIDPSEPRARRGDLPSRARL